ncbi:MAG: hypothetical protein MK102_02655 [Fuerstiella sp.]|nr:hypothetical protein [Fuerstiella sp.]
MGNSVRSNQLSRRLLIETAILGIAASVVASAADGPNIDRLYPAGGQLGTSVNIQLGGQPGKESLQSWSSLGQLEITIAEDKKFATIVIPENVQPGVHWLRFFNASGTSALRPFVVGHIAEIVEEESNDLQDQADEISDEAVTINGVLSQAGDVDICRIRVPAGRTLVASMQANEDLGSPMDATLQLLNEAGTVIAQNDDDHGMDPQIAFNVRTEGVFYVRTFAFPSAPNSTIKLAGAENYIYRLTVTHGPFIDHVFPAVLDHRSTSAVTVCGWNLTEQLQTVGVTSFEGQQTCFGRKFALPHNLYGVKHPSHVESTVSRAIAVNSSITGRIAVPGEKDVYMLPGIKDQTLTVSVQARVFHSLLDPVLTITGADGNVLSEADDGGAALYDSEATMTVPADGLLKVSVEDRFGDGGFRYFYALTCEIPQPAFTATVNANQYLVNNAEAVEVPVTITRTNGYAKRLTVSLEQLPEGVTAESVVSETDGDSSKAVTLKLIRDENAPAFCGAIRVLCRAEDCGDRQLATAAIENSKSTTSEIWLTVIPGEETPSKEGG